ncbi:MULTISPECIES: HAD domain-containing protein [Sphingobacterium]|uniref:HAD domain-containing protein n=1 Tax=Sphingobacterium tenebrionis TaxID=3111775 RepID=A0ABU8I698_9SPHI|nr:HAD domain-containing protein [Sphingobacterium sp. CZ-2]QBR11879.1 hypothetical protein E3D81_06760 [Sphingobacterium sp. CZ-2]
MIVFLDIDGVMVHANPHRKVELEDDGFYKFNELAVDILKSILYTSKDEIILSTSHRFKYNIAQWKQIFHRRGLKFKNVSILGNNSSIVNKDNNIRLPINRRTEIFNYIQFHNYRSEDIIIIDDDKSLNDLPNKFKERLVLTNPYTGLNNINPLKEVLNRKTKSIKI